MNIIITGGGTAGHINPALAIADYAKENIKDVSILFCGTKNGMEATLVKKAGYDFTPIEVCGLARSISFSAIKQNVKALYLAYTAKQKARKVINDFKPDLVIGTGGYVSGPLVLQAAKMKIPTAIHESNSYPGVTTKLLASKVDYTFLATSDAIKHLHKNAKSFVVGNPLRSSILNLTSKQNARKILGITNQFMIFSVGGSLGADSINQACVDLIKWHSDKNNNKNIYHKHGYGKLRREKFPIMLKEKNIDIDKLQNVSCSEYIDNIDICYSAADLIICRCGAMTLSELAALGKPAILIPSPNVTENHQYYNGLTFVNKNAAFMIQEKDYNEKELIKLVDDLYSNPNKLKEIGENAKSLSILNTTELIFDTIGI